MADVAKGEMKLRHLNDFGELRLESTEIIYAYPTEWFDRVHVGQYRQWIERHRKCISTQCAYFEKTDVETLIEILTCGTYVYMASINCM